MPDQHPLIQRLNAAVQARCKAGLGRALLPVDNRDGRTVHMDGREYLNFSSNDFLGLAQDPDAAVELARICRARGCGAGASRLVTGTSRSTLEAEQVLAAYFGYESSLILGSGFLANLTLLAALFDAKDTLLLDKRAHASTMAGLAQSRAQFHTFRHNCLEHLEKRLHDTHATAVLTESMFSMDADSPDFDGLKKLKQKFNFFCIVDEAHALGVLGDGGRGLAKPVADVAVGTLGKAFGLFGAFVLMPAAVRDYLIHFGLGFIYTTALPPWHGDMVLAMLERVGRANDRRERLHRLAKHARQLLAAAGLTVRGERHILAVEVGNEANSLAMADSLREMGILVFAARYPTVPLGQAMLRVCLTSEHTHADLERLRDALFAARRTSEEG